MFQPTYNIHFHFCNFLAGCRKEATLEVIAPLLRELSDRSVDEEILLRQGKQQQQHAGGGSASTVIAPGKGGGGGGGAAGGAAASSAVGNEIGLDHGGVAVAEGVERVRLDAERQILLTMLLAHMCASNDATPRTFVEQVMPGGGLYLY